MVVQKRVFHLQRVVVGAVRVFQRVDHTGPEKKAAAGISVPEPRLDSCECYSILHMIPYGGTEVQGRSTRELESEASHKVNTPVRAPSTIPYIVHPWVLPLHLVCCHHPRFHHPCDRRHSNGPSAPIAGHVYSVQHEESPSQLECTWHMTETVQHAMYVQAQPHMVVIRKGCCCAVRTAPERTLTSIDDGHGFMQRALY